MAPYQATMIAERRPIVFRADASDWVGGGHVMRCLTLATAWAEEGWHVGFAVNARALSIVPALAGRIVDILVLNESDTGTDEASALAARWPDGVALLVVDHYGRDATFERSCRPWAAAILAIDDLADRRHRADFLLDQTPGREARDYDGLVPPGCAMLLGGRYALIRPSFAARRTATARRERIRPRRLYVGFGATDTHGLTLLAIEAVARAGLDIGVDAVMGAAARGIEAVKQAAASTDIDVTIHVQTGDVDRLMAEADFGLGACGGSALERCAVGLPCIAVVAADNQRLIAENLAAAGAVELVGEAGELTAEVLAVRIAALAGDVSRRRAMARATASVCDGKGVERVVAELTAGRSRRPLGASLNAPLCDARLR